MSKCFIYGGEMGEKERQNDLCTVVRGSSEKAGAVRNGNGIQAWAAAYSHICVFDSQG